MEPWICPRCQTVHAWWVAHCDCPPKTITITGNSITCTCGTSMKCQIHEYFVSHTICNDISLSATS